jgi:hypothetical protein
LFASGDSVLQNLNTKETFKEYNEVVKGKIRLSYGNRLSQFQELYGNFTAAVGSEEFYKIKKFNSNENEIINRKLTSEEKKLLGGKVSKNGNPMDDTTSMRITWLIHNNLKKITQDPSGWFVLYQDANDNRYWELSYPQSELHGGGMPMLTNISSEDAHSKYHLDSGTQ